MAAFVSLLFEVADVPAVGRLMINVRPGASVLLAACVGHLAGCTLARFHRSRPDRTKAFVRQGRCAFEVRPSSLGEDFPEGGFGPVFAHLRRQFVISSLTVLSGCLCLKSPVDVVAGRQAVFLPSALKFGL